MTEDLCMCVIILVNIYRPHAFRMVFFDGEEVGFPGLTGGNKTVRFLNEDTYIAVLYIVVWRSLMAKRRGVRWSDVCVCVCVCVCVSV